MTKKKQKKPHEKPAKKIAWQPILKSIPVPVKENNIFIFSVLGTYILIGLVGVFHHEMWRDEMQTWLVGSSSKSFSDFLFNMKMESNPLLWYSCNFLLSRFTGDPKMALVFHFLISAGTVFLILKYSPFNRVQKILLCFSYFIFFEYALIARGYALTVLFLFMFCTFFPSKHPWKYIILSFILFLLSNTTGAHGVLLSASLAGMMVIDYFFSKDVTVRKAFSIGQLFFSLIIVSLGVYIAMKAITPPDNSDRAASWFTKYDGARLIHTIQSLWNAFVPMPDMFNKYFWNSNILNKEGMGDATKNILTLTSVLFFLIPAVLFSRKISVLLFFFAAVGGILLFCYSNEVLVRVYGARHHGFLFLTFISSCWLMLSNGRANISLPSFKASKFFAVTEKILNPFLIVVLIANFAGGAVAYAKDFTLTFSAIEKTGEFIVEHKLDQMTTTGFVDYCVSPVTAITRHPMYFPDRDTISTYTIWSTDRYSTTDKVVTARMMDFIRHQKDSTLVILNFELGPKFIEDIAFEKKAYFSESVVRDETYSVYVAKKIDMQKELAVSSQSAITDDKADYLIAYGFSDVDKGNIAEAEMIANKVFERSSGREISRLHNLLGMIYSKKNMADKAKEEFYKEIKWNKKADEAYFQLGYLFYQQQKIDSAIAAWEKVITLNPNYVDAYNNLGVCYMNFKSNPEKAEEYWKKTVQVNPNYLQGYFNLMVIYQNRKDEESLLNNIRQVLMRGASLNDIKSKGIYVTEDMLKKLN